MHWGCIAESKPVQQLGNVVAIYGRAFLRKVRNDFLF
jgi:hypothetical protein